MSSANDIQGRNCLFQMKVGDEYLDIMCAKTWSISFATDMKETTTVQSGFWKEFRPRKLSYTASFNGVVMIVAPDDKPTIKSLFLNQINYLPVNYRMIIKDNSDQLMVIVGQLFVNSTVFDANPINLLNGTVQFQGNGPVELTDNIPEYIILTIETIRYNSDSNGKFRLILTNNAGDTVFDSSIIPQTQLKDGWLIPGDIITSQVEKGAYYFTIQYKDVTSDGNTFSLSGPPPAPGTRTFDHGDAAINDYPTFYDFTANRTASFVLGDPYVPPACIDVTIEGSPLLPNGEVGQAYSYSFPLTGTAPFILTINDRPEWMDITVFGSNVFFTGIALTAGTNIPVSITITNCSEGTASLSQDIEIIPPTKGKLVLAKLGDNPVTICASTYQSVYILPPASAAFPGVRIFSDEAMTTPVVADYIVPDNFIKNVYSIDSSTPGESYVGSETGNVC